MYFGQEKPLAVALRAAISKFFYPMRIAGAIT